MKPAVTFISAGIALLFLAMCYSVASPVALFLYSGVTCPHNPNVFCKPDIFALNYWFCEILGIVFVGIGIRKLWNEQ